VAEEEGEEGEDGEEGEEGEDGEEGAVEKFWPAVDGEEEGAREEQAMDGEEEGEVEKADEDVEGLEEMEGASVIVGKGGVLFLGAFFFSFLFI
jgi:hypothetical protein